MRKQSGFTLIEVMVAVFVLAIGVLGMAGMQATGVREAQNTYFRTQADMLANDIVDRMRANRQQVIDDTTYLTAGADPGVANTCGAMGGGAVEECDGQTMAGFDLQSWYNAINSSNLPSATGVITQVAGSATTYTIQVFWDENRDGSNDQVCGNTLGQDGCVRLTVEF